MSVNDALSLLQTYMLKGVTDLKKPLFWVFKAFNISLLFIYNTISSLKPQLQFPPWAVYFQSVLKVLQQFRVGFLRVIL